MNTIITFVLTAIIIFLSCSSSSQKALPQKFDTPLAQKIEEVESSGSGEVIKVFGKCREAIGDEMRAALTASGVQVESVTGDIFTASGTPAALRDLARLDFVTQIQLSTISKPL